MDGTMEYTHGINTPLLRKVLEYVTEHRDEWRQGYWATRNECGTSYCLAGHVAAMNGETLDWSRHGDANRLASGQLISAYAADQLGIPYVDNPRDFEQLGEGVGAQYIPLFQANNTLPELWRIASRLTQGEIEIPPGLSDAV